jgi:hypothetical protein
MQRKLNTRYKYCRFGLIPCSIEYVENNQSNSLNYIFLFHVMAPTCFDNNYAIFREHLISF